MTFVTLQTSDSMGVRKGQREAEGLKVVFGGRVDRKEGTSVGGQNRVAEIDGAEFLGVRLQVSGEQEDAFRFKGTANACDGSGELFFDEGVLVGVGEVFVEGAFEDVCEEQAEFLEFGEEGFRGLPFRGKPDGIEDYGGFAAELRAGRIEEVGVLGGCDAGEKKSLDVERAEARGASEAIEATGDVSRICELAAAVTGEKIRIGHG